MLLRAELEVRVRVEGIVSLGMRRDFLDQRMEVAALLKGS
jgi:hypothetical protein